MHHFVIRETKEKFVMEDCSGLNILALSVKILDRV